MKKRFTLIKLGIVILLLILFTCQQEKITNKPVIKTEKSSYTIQIGEPIEISPIVESDSKTHYQWVENYIELSKKPSLTYKSEQIGKHTITFTVVNKGGVIEKKYTITVIEETKQ